MKKIISTLSILLIGLSLFYSCKVSRFIFYNFADITDYTIFPSHPIERDSLNNPFIYPKATKDFTNQLFAEDLHLDLKTFEAKLIENKTVAFLVIQNDSIRYENYFDSYQPESIVASFSMAKSILSILIGCAIDDGLIQSEDETVGTYIPSFNTPNYQNITIKHVLNMTSGLDFNESYFNPFGNAASLYYGCQLEKEIFKLQVKTAPGTQFHYSSGDSQILGLVLKSALKGKSIAQYLEEKIWIPMAMEYDASWSIDSQKNQTEKTFCCLNARARDFAKIGSLMLHKGNWNGQQIVSENWIERSTKFEKIDGDEWFYQYQWWINSEKGDYHAEGINGQFIYINPEKNLIMVRLGKRYGNQLNWNSLFTEIANQM